MSASNHRLLEYETVHHLISRIAHRVLFLGEEERNDFLDIVRRAAAFSGVQLLAWCVMTNHFHLLVHLPTPTALDEPELLRRYEQLKGRFARDAAVSQLAKWRLDGNDQQAKRWLDALRKRMYNIGEFMKIIKQWFTEEYNHRQKHVGTLWESVYRDFPVPVRMKDMSRVAGYIHLNPIRAAVADSYDGYCWSSFSALAKGDETAVKGMRFVYGDDAAIQSSLIARHTILLDELLEGVKRQRAEEIARKRAAGYALPSDPLTSEAMIAQASAHLDEVQNALVELHVERDLTRRTVKRRRDVSDKIFMAALLANPSASVATLSQMLSLAPSSVYERLRKLKAQGLITRCKPTEPWQIVQIP